MSRKILVLAIAMVLISVAGDLLACSVCFGDPNSKMSQGTRTGVFFMVGVITVVLGAIFTVIIYWIRRARWLRDSAHGSFS
jgi:hypothetical protein